ncbi:cytochrome C oxidase subunit IV family protein [Shewanella sp. SR44-3]|uniref:cytochrome C oxidase subunit IV family protein n=1 Tax=unclassified Shewanella TaxID=196818 RepID=UPI0015F9AA34|nr:cytochrome C oxidase subunit IV family protein [Shewanella sp. SR44-3]MBB1270537.1 cytochrome C oxidase subunit IV family protein [Shewanella sp. SR44-3]
MPNLTPSKSASAIHKAAIILIGLTCLTTAMSYFPVFLPFPMSTQAIAFDVMPLAINTNIKLISVVLIVLMTMIKGIQIVDVFMEMRTAPKAFRLFALSYPIIIPLILAAILYL